jgi:hypothetical protein
MQGASDALFDRALRVEIDRGHRTSANFTTSAIGVSISPSGRKNRQNTMPNARPSVSIQFVTPRSARAIIIRKLPSSSSFVLARFRLTVRCA